MSNGERRLVIPRHDPINAITMGAIVLDACLTPQQFRDLRNCSAAALNPGAGTGYWRESRVPGTCGQGSHRMPRLRADRDAPSS